MLNSFKNLFAAKERVPLHIGNPCGYGERLLLGYDDRFQRRLSLALDRFETRCAEMPVGEHASLQWLPIICMASPSGCWLVVESPQSRMLVLTRELLDSQWPWLQNWLEETAATLWQQGRFLKTSASLQLDPAMQRFLQPSSQRQDSGWLAASSFPAPSFP